MKLDQIEEEPVKKMEPCGAIDTNGRKSIEKRGTWQGHALQES